MASGYFPLRKSAVDGQKLVEAARLISEVIKNWREECLTQDQPDNAYSDGGHMAELHLAERLVTDAVTRA